MAIGQASVKRGATRLLLSVLALGLFASAAAAQSRQSCPPPQGGGSRSSGGSVTVDPGAVIDALKWAAKKKRDADAKKKADAEKAAAAERERIAQAERDRAIAEREADAAKMKPIPDPAPEPEPARTSPTRPAADGSHGKPTAGAGPRGSRPPPPELLSAPEATKHAVAPPTPIRPSVPTPAAPAPTPAAAPAPVTEVTAEPAPVPPPVAAPPPVPPPLAVPVDVTDDPPWRTLALGLTALLVLLVVALFAARQFLGWGMGPIEVRPGMDPGDMPEPDFAGLAGPVFSVHVRRGEASSELHYPQAVEGQT